jgi:hypothetical protein
MPGLSPRRRWFFRIVAVLFSIICALVAVELSLWIIAPIPFHEWMEWVPDGHIKGRAKPLQKFLGGTGYGVTEAQHDGKRVELHEVLINRLGFRGPEYSWQPSPGTLRVVVFGGSAGFCYHQKEEDTWPGRLQVYLSNQLKMPVEVVNLSLPGFDSSNSKINYLFSGRALNPHIVIIYHTWNDVKFFRGIEKSPQTVAFASVAANKPLWQRLARLTQIGRRLRNMLLARHMNKPYGETQYTSLASEGLGANIPVNSTAFQWARKNFADFARFAHSDNVLPVLVTQATIVAQENLHKEEYHKPIAVNAADMVGMSFPVLLAVWKEMNNIIKESCSRESAVFIDGYNAIPHNYTYLEDHIHLTTEGCDLLAQEISQNLLKDERFMKIVTRIRQNPR